MERLNKMDEFAIKKQSIINTLEGSFITPEKLKKAVNSLIKLVESVTLNHLSLMVDMKTDNREKYEAIQQILSDVNQSLKKAIGQLKNGVDTEIENLKEAISLMETSHSEIVKEMGTIYGSKHNNILDTVNEIKDKIEQITDKQGKEAEFRINNTTEITDLKKAISSIELTHSEGMSEMKSETEKEMKKMNKEMEDGYNKCNKDLEKMKSNMTDLTEEIKKIDEKIEDELKKMKKFVNRPAIGGSPSPRNDVYDLSSQTNGVLKSFSIPGYTKVYYVLSSDFPIALLNGNGFTLSGQTLTLTTENAPSAGSQLFVWFSY